MVVCKICEKDIAEEKLGPHSLKCKEVAQLREELLQIKVKMENHSENGQRMKRSLETQATKQKNIQKKHEEKLEPPSFGMLTRARTQPLGRIIQSMNDKTRSSDDDTSKKTESPSGMKSLFKKKSIEVESMTEVMSAEEFKKFKQETKRGILALANVVTMADNINDWIGDTASAIEVDFNMKNELISLYEEIIDSNVSEFLKTFISDLSNYIDVQANYSKKKNELIAFDSEEGATKTNPHSKFWAQRSSSYRVQHVHSKNFSKGKAVAQKVESSLPMAQVQETASELQETETSLADHFNNKTSLRNRILLKNQLAYQSQAEDEGKDDKDHSAEREPQVMESMSMIRRGTKKKTSIIISVNHMQLDPGSPEEKPSIKITYSDHATKEPSSFGQDARKSLGQKLDQPSKFLKARQKNKIMNSNLLQNLQESEEPSSGQLFPSLQLNNKQEEEDDDFDDSPAHSHGGKSVGWQSPYMRGYYSDAFKTKSARLLSLGDSPKLQIDEFEFVRFLGKGAYGTVWLVKKKATNDLYAMKIVDWADRFTQNRIFSLKAERDIYEVLQGDYVVKAVWTFHFQNYICFVTEYMIGGDFSHILDDVGRLDEDQARFYFAELVVAIEALHNLGIVHRDLKPDNILMDAKGHIRLTDFGLSEGGLSQLRMHSSPDANKQKQDPSKFKGLVSMKTNSSESEDKHKGAPAQGFQVAFKEKSKESKEEDIFTFLGDKDQYTAIGGKKPKIMKKATDNKIGEEKKLAKVGTPDYMAPEVIDADQVKLQNYNERCMDWWSMGVILYQFLVGIPPFCDESLDRVFDNVRNRRMDWPSIGEGEDCISHEAADLIEKLLEVDPSKRLGVKGTQEVKDHPFFKGIDWAHINEKDGPIIPWVQNEELESTSQPDSGIPKEKLPFVGLNGKGNKNANQTSINLEDFQLTRLDVLDKLNQEQYKEFKKRKSQELKSEIKL